MRIVLILFLLGFASPALADAAFQFAAPNLRAPDDPHVNGVRFTVIRGENRSVRGLDLGMFAYSETRNLTGFRSVLGVGRLHGDMSGVASSIVNLHDGVDRGANVALVNRVRKMASGVNLALVNLVSGSSTTDVGGMNISKRSAVQVGLLNIADRIDGVQLGLLNLAENGFLPVFPLFNFPVD